MLVALQFDLFSVVLSGQRLPVALLTAALVDTLLALPSLVGTV